MGVVELSCHGQWGNRLGEYAAARLLADKLGFGLRLCPVLLEQYIRWGQPLPRANGLAWRGTVNTSYAETLARIRYKSRSLPFSEMMTDNKPRIVALDGYPFGDYAPLRAYKEKIRSWLRIDTGCVTALTHLPQPGPNDIV
eukprot:UC1_evm1s1758